jgi:hypothetical protein
MNSDFTPNRKCANRETTASKIWPWVLGVAYSTRMIFRTVDCNYLSFELADETCHPTPNRYRSNQRGLYTYLWGYLPSDLSVLFFFAFKV